MSATVAKNGLGRTAVVEIWAATAVVEIWAATAMPMRQICAMVVGASTRGRPLRLELFFRHPVFVHRFQALLLSLPTLRLRFLRRLRRPRPHFATLPTLRRRVARNQDSRPPRLRCRPRTHLRLLLNLLHVRTAWLPLGVNSPLELRQQQAAF